MYGLPSSKTLLEILHIRRRIQQYKIMAKWSFFPATDNRVANPAGVDGLKSFCYHGAKIEEGLY